MLLALCLSSRLFAATGAALIFGATGTLLRLKSSHPPLHTRTPAKATSVQHPLICSGKEHYMRRPAVIIPIIAAILVVGCLIGAIVRASGSASPAAQATPYQTMTSAPATATATTYATTTATAATTTATTAPTTITATAASPTAAVTATTETPDYATATTSPATTAGPNQLPYTGAVSNATMLLLIGLAFLGLGVAWSLWLGLNRAAAVGVKVTSGKQDRHP